MREEKRNKLLDKLDYSFKMREMTWDEPEVWETYYEYGLNALDQAYQFGKKEAVKDFDKKQKSHSNKPHSSHKWQSALSICWRCVEDRKKEMLEPLSTEENE